MFLRIFRKFRVIAVCYSFKRNVHPTDIKKINIDVTLRRHNVNLTSFQLSFNRLSDMTLQDGVKLSCEPHILQEIGKTL